MAVIIWLGGALIFSLVLCPVLRNHYSSPREFAEIIEKIGNRFKTISWEAVGVIILTGIFNVINAGYLRNFDFSSSYINFFILKLVLVVVILIGQGIYNSVYLPKLILIAKSYGQKSGSYPESYNKIRRKISVLWVVNIGFAIVVIYIGLGLKFM